MKLRVKIQQKNKQIKLLALCAIATFYFSVTGLTARADSITDKGDNDTMETAETIEANDETPSSTLLGSKPGQNVVRGYANTKDTDWYKVFLHAGDNYMTCNANSGKSFIFRITNSDGDTISTDTYTKSGFGPKAYRFTTSTDGYYYVEITGTSTISDEYIFMIGSPTYQLASCKISCDEGSVSFTSAGRDQLVHFNGNVVSGLPEDAIAYYVKMAGIPLNGTSSVRVENLDREISFTLTNYTWYRDKLVAMELPVESMWTAEFGYHKTVTFAPVLNVDYVYPVYDRVLQPY
ncbi:MAG: hypothetical protein K2K90_12140 [Lachnospiraceae bacterium]|nr:hypothetical protein [Lachnospiraceae bacterium]